MSTSPVDLDDPSAVTAADTSDVLRAVASAAAQVREATVLSAEAGLDRLADDGRPRSVLVCGTGDAATAGDALAAVAGTACPVPVLVHRSPVLPAWVGAADVVVAVSPTGRTPETLSVLEEAVRRGCRLVVVGAPGSPLEALGARGRALVVPVVQGRHPRAQLWSATVPLLSVGHALGLLTAGPDELAEAARVLEEVATSCRPDADTTTNPAKALALDLAGTLPVLWGSTGLTAVAAQRFAASLAAAGLPAVAGGLPEAARSQLPLLDGPWAGRTGGARSVEDLFADREDDVDRPVLRLVLLREPAEPAAAARLADVCAGLAVDRGVAVSSLLADGASAPARLASLVGLADFAAAYLALSEGTDPSPAAAVAALEERTQR